MGPTLRTSPSLSALSSAPATPLAGGAASPAVGAIGSQLGTPGASSVVGPSSNASLQIASHSDGGVFAVVVVSEWRKPHGKVLATFSLTWPALLSPIASICQLTPLSSLTSFQMPHGAKQPTESRDVHRVNAATSATEAACE
mmetsp:Transcript_50215/g.130721  ORF Transcript_50215/g.130721 Transcript_50215/m.130721 type:complete len:142 (+) Transcript_50215:105-530(+)